MPVAGSEAVLTPAQIQEMAKERGGVKASVLPQDPAKMTGAEAQQILQFGDGTYIVVTHDFNSGDYRVDDWATTGQLMADTAKTQAKNEQFQIQQVGNKLVQIFGDGRVVPIMDIPDAQ